MAGYPPPYPPPSQPPFGFDPRQQRRILRDQTRAQLRAMKSANRAQQNLYRNQARALRRSSILGPLIVIAVGLTFFLTRLRDIPFSRFAVWFAQWWPLLLVLAGVVLLVEWAIDQHLSASRGLPVRRGLGAGTVFLLILIALAGASIGAFHIDRGFQFHNFSIDADNLGEFLGERHQREQQLDGTIPAGTTVEIDNPHGDITVNGGSPDGQVHVTVDKQIYSFSDTDTDRKEHDLNATMNLGGQTLRIDVPSVSGSSADLSVSLPDSSPAVIHARRGAVSVSGLKAAVNVSADRGDVDLQSIAGPVTAHLNSTDSSFHAHQIEGGVELKGRAEDVSVTDVSGPVSLEGEFYGDTNLEHLRAPLHFKTERTQFSLARLDGEVEISPNSELTGSDIAGPTLLHTRNRNVALEGVAGDISVVNSNGHVDLTSALPLGNVSVDNSNGDVSLTLPEHSGYSVKAETRGGTINNDLGFSSSEQGDHQTLVGKRGTGAASVVLRTSTADISLHEAVASSLTPPPDAAAPPAPANGKAKRPARSDTPPQTPLRTETF